MASGKITRTVVTANAWYWKFDGQNPDGSPHMTKDGSVEFISTSPNQVEAFRALKGAGIKCRKDFCGFDIVSEDVYSMDFDTFLEHAVKVERLANGRVKELTEWTKENAE